uniref:Uncharacterized protein n=1 Tax=Anopheles coluzzii TaxID=1518534 RepID=A0A8W7PXR3_ANOCL
MKSFRVDRPRGHSSEFGVLKALPATYSSSSSSSSLRAESLLPSCSAHRVLAFLLMICYGCELPPSTLRELFADLLQHGAAFACPRTLASINLAVSLGPAASLSFMSLLRGFAAHPSPLITQKPATRIERKGRGRQCSRCQARWQGNWEADGLVQRCTNVRLCRCLAPPQLRLERQRHTHGLM